MSVTFTKHALDRFCERLESMCGSRPKNPEKVARKLLARAKEVSLDDKRRFMRLLANGCQEARYLSVEGWRFVVVGEVVVTIERESPEQNRKKLPEGLA